MVAESIDVEDSSGSKGRVALIQNLHKIGFEVKVYHYTRKEINLESISCRAIKEDRRSVFFYLSRIQRKLQHTFNWNLAKYLESWLGFSFTFLNDSRSIVKALKREKTFQPDLVLTLSKGASFRPHYAILKIPEFYSKWLAYIHDPYPLYYYPEPYTWAEPGYQRRIEFFQEVANKCRWAGYPSQLLAEWMEHHYPNFKNKRMVIPHQLFIENESPVALPQWFDPEKFILLHAGNLMKQRNPMPLVNGFQKFLEENPQAISEAHLIFIGSASYHLSKLKKAEQEINELYVSKGNLEYNVVLKLQHKASVNIILEAVAKESPFLPGKFPHCVAANKPILHLGPEESEVRRLLGEKHEYSSSADDSSRIAEKIKDLYFKWKYNRGNFTLDRPDLKMYLSETFLEEQIGNL